MSTPVVPRIEPDYLGPLAPHDAQPQSSGDLFAGDDRYLSASQRRKRRALWHAVAPVLEGLLASDEHVLYMAPAHERVPFHHRLGLGWLAPHYHQVALVFTDRRLVEVLLGFFGQKPATRTRTWPWRDVRTVTRRFRSIRVTPSRTGKTRAWTLKTRGDRRLLGLLLPRLEQRATGDADPSRPSLPLWHCPNCRGVVTENGARCDACGTRFRTASRATLLSLAFPGAGLWYAGRPVLGALDFLGEWVVLSACFLIAVGAESPSAWGVAVGVGILLLGLTKLESIHVGRILVRRTIPESESWDGAWKTIAVVGSTVSAAAVVGAFFLDRGLAGVVDRDLDFAAPGWTGSRVTAEWESWFASDTMARSRWRRDDGLIVWVVARALEPRETPESLWREFSGGGEGVVVSEKAAWGAFSGFRCLKRTGDVANPLVIIHYFVLDTLGEDVHTLVTAHPPDLTAPAEEALRALMEGARWIEAVPPIGKPSDAPTPVLRRRGQAPPLPAGQMDMARTIVGDDFKALAELAEEHFAESGEYPASDRVLYAAWIERRPGQREPYDPFSGRRYGYLRRGGGFFLYSAGPDGVARTDDDVVFDSRAP